MIIWHKPLFTITFFVIDNFETKGRIELYFVIRNQTNANFVVYGSTSFDSVTVRAGSTLNQHPWDESFGLDDVFVWVR